jgi:hypothetical protein
MLKNFLDTLFATAQLLLSSYRITSNNSNQDMKQINLFFEQVRYRPSSCDSSQGVVVRVADPLSLQALPFSLKKLPILI